MELSRLLFFAGSMKLFEYPRTLEVFDITKQELEKGEAVFPFIMPQAPIKPIIHSKQLLEYMKASRFLGLEEEVIDKTLVVVGYGLNGDDNHINALLREFVVKGGRLIVYKHYKSDRSCSEEKMLREVFKALKLPWGEPGFLVELMVEQKVGVKKFEELIDMQLG